MKKGVNKIEKQREIWYQMLKNCWMADFSEKLGQFQVQLSLELKPICSAEWQGSMGLWWAMKWGSNWIRQCQKQGSIAGKFLMTFKYGRSWGEKSISKKTNSNFDANYDVCEATFYLSKYFYKWNIDSPSDLSGRRQSSKRPCQTCLVALVPSIHTCIRFVSLPVTDLITYLYLSLNLISVCNVSYNGMVKSQKMSHCLKQTALANGLFTQQNHGVGEISNWI